MSTTREKLLPITYQPWVENALCANYRPHLWDGDLNHRTRIAKKICQRCPVSTECLQEALTIGEPFTIRGGLTADERNKLGRAS